MRVSRLALVSAVICSAACCELATEEEVNVLIPAPPVAWQVSFPGMAFRIVTRDARNVVQEKVVDDWRTPAAVTCVRSVNAPVLAYPREGHLRPAGGFYPLSLRELHGREVLELTWMDGAAALVTARLVEQGRDVSLFNVERLRRFLEDTGDPWEVDLDVVTQKVSLGDFTARDIDKLPSRDADIDTGPGTWFLESPFSASFDATNGRIRLTGVCLGFHHLFSLDGGRWSLEVGRQETILTDALSRDSIDHFQTVKSTPRAP
jgi:hypothetical protein